MQRCLELAKLGAGYVAPNPMVGAVLVNDDRIIGEGWHKAYGDPHAEVNCINKAVQNGHRALIQDSTLYVSLEPCAHFGKTPPCTDLIIKHKIPGVVIGCRDPFEKVSGRGIEKLKAAGVNVEVGVLEHECEELNKRFFTFHTKKRPYVILKWAETGDGFIAPPLEGFGEASVVRRLQISNEYSNKLAHQWRAEEAAILVGTNTALYDDPELTTRLWPGPSPVRLVVDMNLKLPPSLKIFNRRVRTIVFNAIKNEEAGNLQYFRVIKDVSLVQQILTALNELKLQSLIVEGGARFLQSFIDEGAWDEARVITNGDLVIHQGLKAPILSKTKKREEQKLLNDKIVIYLPSETTHDSLLTPHVRKA